MFYKKKGLPKENEIVLCTVDKVLKNSIFIRIDEYDGMEGLIHISEIAPGRIRNIRDYVKEGKKIVCKVLRVKSDTRQVDLSLRRVANSEALNKRSSMKQEEKAEKILEAVGKMCNKTLKQMYDDVGMKIIMKYGLISNCFQQLVENDSSILKSLGIDAKIADLLTKIVKERIKPSIVEIIATVVLKSRADDGIERIKHVLKNIIAMGEKNKYKINFHYLGAPRYKLTITADDYKQAEKELAEITALAESEVKKQDCQIEFIRA
ncbi:MAG TPA: S1 RNA-binding domain-containing protein [Candidatus Nanoarchaeia archaeon]|nr:S1 RNA-binding domain-containing protein [Candidatus Nanoarchaeia archaeon]